MSKQSDKIKESETFKELQKVLQEFFDSTSHITKIENLNTPVIGTTGIDSYNGDYLVVPINESVYIKDALSSTYEQKKIDT